MWLGLRKDKMGRLTWRPFFLGADIFLALDESCDMVVVLVQLWMVAESTCLLELQLMSELMREFCALKSNVQTGQTCGRI